MLEQHPDRDLALRAAAICAEIRGYGIVEADPMLVVKHHDRGRRRNHLGERREIIHRARGINLGARAVPVERSVSVFPYQPAVPPNDDRDARIAARVQPAFRDVGDGRQSIGRHPDRIGWNVPQQAVRGIRRAPAEQRERQGDQRGGKHCPATTVRCVGQPRPDYLRGHGPKRTVPFAPAPRAAQILVACRAAGDGDVPSSP